MNANHPNFAEHFEIRELLDISKAHLDALDRSRMSDGVVIGNDNFANLKVATIFSGIAIEAALNDFIQIHCLFIHEPYMQSFFAEVTTHYLWAGMDRKIKLLRKCWHISFPDELINDVMKLIGIRNRIVHQTGRFKPDQNRSHGISALSNYPLTADKMRHMLRHYDIAKDFLSLFWLPGDIELQQGISDDERK